MRHANNSLIETYIVSCQSLKFSFDFQNFIRNKYHIMAPQLSEFFSSHKSLTKLLYDAEFSVKDSDGKILVVNRKVFIYFEVIQNEEVRGNNTSHK